MALRSVVGIGRTKLNYYLMNPIPIYKTHKNLLAGKLGFGHKNKYFDYCTASDSSSEIPDYIYVYPNIPPDILTIYESHNVDPIIPPEVLALTYERCGGCIHNIPDTEFHKYHIMDSAHFAVNKHNEDQNGHLEFVRVVEAKIQYVAGINVFITLEAKDALVGKVNKYHAEVWVKPWMKIKQLQVWKPVDD